jgi:ATP synthase F1 delta subunit
LYSISNNFSAWVAEQQQCLFGEFITAVAVSETYKNRAAQILAKKYQKKVLLKSKVSPHILGGFMIKIFNGRVIDASLRGQLQNLQKSISEER